MSATAHDAGHENYLHAWLVASQSVDEFLARARRGRAARRRGPVHWRDEVGAGVRAVGGRDRVVHDREDLRPAAVARRRRGDRAAGAIRRPAEADPRRERRRTARAAAADGVRVRAARRRRRAARRAHGDLRADRVRARDHRLRRRLAGVGRLPSTAHARRGRRHRRRDRRQGGSRSTSATRFARAATAGPRAPPSTRASS